MFDQVLNAVKQHLDQDPAVAGQIPAEHREEVHQEVAKGVTDGLKNQAGGGLGGMVSSLTGGGGGGGGSVVSSVTSAVSERLTGKFGLSQSAVQAISGAVPKIVQQFMK
ncbi:MAG TPA: hypothetical protein VGD92_09230 [Sphingobacteriaceae bacterium]